MQPRTSGAELREPEGSMAYRRQWHSINLSNLREHDQPDPGLVLNACIVARLEQAMSLLCEY